MCPDYLIRNPFYILEEFFIACRGQHGGVCATIDLIPVLFLSYIVCI